jgi:hypothetical protein
MWSCGRTSFSDGNVLEAGGCHSPAQSSQPKELKFTNQKMIYDRVVIWQKPVKEGVTEVKTALTLARSRMMTAHLSDTQSAQVQLMLNQAQSIIDTVIADGSWGVHAPQYTLDKVKEAKVLTTGANSILLGGDKKVAKK